MELIEYKPYFWALYKDNDGMYLDVLININAFNWTRTIRLNSEMIQLYADYGLNYINHLATQVEQSQAKNMQDDSRFVEVSREQKDAMLNALRVWKNK